MYVWRHICSDFVSLHRTPDWIRNTSCHPPSSWQTNGTWVRCCVSVCENADPAAVRARREEGKQTISGLMNSLRLKTNESIYKKNCAVPIKSSLGCSLETDQMNIMRFKDWWNENINMFIRNIFRKYHLNVIQSKDDLVKVFLILHLDCSFSIPPI